MLRFAIPVALLVGVCLFGPHESVACSCAMVPAGEQLDLSQRVFTGTVIATEVIADEGAAQVHRSTLRVHAVWKGDASTQVLVDTMPVASCNLVLQPGAEYLVYAEPGPKEGIFRTHECFRTRRVEHAQEDLDDLGEPLFTVETAPLSLGTMKARY